MNPPDESQAVPGRNAPQGVAENRNIFQIEKEAFAMMNLQQAIAYGKRVGVQYYVCNDKDCIVGGTRTRENAEAMKKRFEIEDRKNPWTKGTTRFYIKPAR